MKLSPRLQLIFDHLIPGQAVWDICCDHGLLGRAVIRSALFTEVHMVDQVSSIMERLRREIQERRPDLHLYQGEIDYPQRRPHSTNDVPVFLWTQAGQNTIQYWSGNVVIAGVGSQLIIEILQLYLQHILIHQSENNIQFLLCPQKDIFDLESQLPAHLFIENKILFKEKHRDRILYIVKLKCT